eukprot:Gb_26980 [translate_table: standard]
MCEKLVMRGSIIFHLRLRKPVLSKTVNPCTSPNLSLQQKWVSRYFQSLILQLPMVLPAILLQSAKQSGKAGRKSQNEVFDNAKDEAQQVLQDYLHYTRSLPFADAKHISFNAPCFVRKLLSNVQQHKHIGKALERYLMYYPINEFEPFFESLGLQPSDIPSFLPPDQMYLSENRVLLANVSTFRNNGFPRHELGKLYKELPEIFSCSTGNLQRKLQFYENLGLSKVSLVRILTCCPSLLIDSVHREFETVVNGLSGFQVEKNRICCLIEKYSSNCSSILEKLMLLAGLGCPWDEISRLYRTKPQLFFESSEKALYSLVDFLSNLGLRKKEIGSIILRYAEILKWDLSKSTAINLEFGSVGLDQKELREMIVNHADVLYTGNLLKLIEEANGTEIEKKEVGRLIRDHLKSITSWTPLSKIVSEQLQNTPLEGTKPVNRMDILLVSGCEHKCPTDDHERELQEKLGQKIPRYKLNFLMKLGLEENSDQIIKVARKIFGGNDKLQERLNCLLGLGLSFDVVCKMIRSYPIILNQGPALIQKKADFLCSSIGDPLQALESFPSYLCYDLEYRIKPRYKMYMWLKTNNLLKKEYSICTIIAVSEKIFVQKYVSLHPEGQSLLDYLPQQWYHEQWTDDLNLLYYFVLYNHMRETAQKWRRLKLKTLDYISQSEDFARDKTHEMG